MFVEVVDDIELRKAPISGTPLCEGGFGICNQVGCASEFVDGEVGEVGTGDGTGTGAASDGPSSGNVAMGV